ncbi:MAG: phage tail tape measure protein [Alphaproteobacteria bacterium]|nr:phage tail tape measure protein [Alphaproteobacteria bacterium]
MAQDFRASILAHLDTSNIQREIDDIGNKTITFRNLSFDRSSLINAIQSALDNHRFNINIGNINFNGQNLNNQMRRAGDNAGQQFANSIYRAINGIDLHNGGTGHVNHMLQQLGFDKRSMATIMENLGNMKLKIDEIKTTMTSNGNIQLRVTGQDELLRTVTITREFSKETGEAVNTSKSFAQNFAQQAQQSERNAAAIQKYTAQLDALRAKYRDTNVSNPIQNTNNLNTLDNEYTRIIGLVQNLSTATAETSIRIKANINSEIAGLQSLIATYRNVESAERGNEQQIARNEAAIAKFKSQIEALSAKAFDVNAIKPITNEGNISQLETAFIRTSLAVENLRNADSSTFTQMKADATSEIESLGLLITSFQNAEYVASQLRAKPVEVLKAEEMNKLQAFVAEINKSGVALSSFKTDIGGLRTTLEGVTNSAQLKEYLNVLATAKSEFKALKQEAAQYASAADVSILKSKMEAWLTKNTKAAKTYGAAIKGLISELDSMAAKGGVLATENKRIASSFKQIDAAAGAAGLKGRTFFQSVGKAAQSLGRYFGVSTLIYRSIATLRQGINDVIDLDTALVDLQKTAKATSEELSSFYYDANEQAKEFGVTTKEIIQSAADWSRLGYSLNDSKTMAQVSSIFKSISPGMDMDSATSGLVSVMKGFDIAASDALDGIASKINAIGNSQALSNSNIIEFLTRSSSAMAAANNTLEETIAIGTAARLLAVCTEMCIRNIFNCR